MTLIITWTVGISFSLAFYTGLFVLASRLVH
jgi:hypothetical protein